MALRFALLLCTLIIDVGNVRMTSVAHGRLLHMQPPDLRLQGMTAGVLATQHTSQARSLGFFLCGRCIGYHDQKAD